MMWRIAKDVGPMKLPKVNERLLLMSAFCPKMDKSHFYFAFRARDWLEAPPSVAELFYCKTGRAGRVIE